MKKQRQEPVSPKKAKNGKHSKRFRGLGREDTLLNKKTRKPGLIINSC